MMQDILCSCCGKKVAEIRDGKLYIFARHHSEWHMTVTEVTAYPLDKIMQIVSE